MFPFPPALRCWRGEHGFPVLSILMGTTVVLAVAPMAPDVQLATTLPPAPETRSLHVSAVTRVALAGEAKGGTFRITPERRALLNTIRYAEGT